MLLSVEKKYSGDTLMSKKDHKEKKSLKKMEEKEGRPAVLLSFDGTIMDTEPAVLATYRHVFAVYGKKRVKEKDIPVLLSDTVDTVVKKFFPAKDCKAAEAEYMDYQNDHLIDLIQPMKGSIKLLKWLKENGYKIGIVSSRERSSIVDLLQHFNMGQYPNVIIGHAGDGIEGTRSDSILTACRLMNTKHCVYITDTGSNIISGQQAGAFTVGFMSGTDRTAEFIDAGPDFMTGSFKEIKKLLQGEPLWLAYNICYPEVLEAEKAKEEKKAAAKAQKKLKKQQDKKNSKEKNKKKEPVKSEKKEAKNKIKKHEDKAVKKTEKKK